MTIDFRPDVIHSVKPEQIAHHSYEEIAEYRNVTVQILRCEKCDEISIAWHRQENTEVIYERE